MKAENLLRELVFSGSDSCVEWPGAVQSNGYGTLRFSGRQRLAHRAAYYLSNGVWPNTTMHTCDNRRCVNPEHLVSGTQQANLADMRAKGRGCGPPEVLTDTQKRYIDATYARYKHGCSGPAIAATLGVGARLVTHYINKKRLH